MVTVAALVYAMVAWINSTGMIEPAWPDTGLEINYTHTLGMAEDVARCYVLSGVEPPPAEVLVEQAGGMYGLYCFDRITISSAVDLETIEGQTVLVHELVHWLQNYNGDKEAAACLAELERSAYLIHREWQRTMGLEPYPDETTIAIRSMCPSG